MIKATSVDVKAHHTSGVVDGARLREHGARRINSGEHAGDIFEAVGCSGGIGELACERSRSIDSVNLCGYGIRYADQGVVVPGGGSQSLTGGRNESDYHNCAQHCSYHDYFTSRLAVGVM